MEIPENITILEINDFIDKLGEKRLELLFDKYRVDVLNNLPTGKYNELKMMVRELYKFEKNIKEFVVFEIYCDLFVHNGAVEFDIGAYYNSEDVKTSKDNSIEFKEIKKELNQKLDNIKNEVISLGIDFPLFISKVTYEIERDEKDIKDIID